MKLDTIEENACIALRGMLGRVCLGVAGSIIGAFMGLFAIFYLFLAGAMLLRLNVDFGVAGWVSTTLGTPAGSLLGTRLVDGRILRLKCTNRLRRILLSLILCEFSLLSDWLAWPAFANSDNQFIYVTLVQGVFAYTGYRLGGLGKRGQSRMAVP